MWSYVQSCLEFQYHIKRLTFNNPTVKAYKVGGPVAWGWTGVMMGLGIGRVRTTLCTYFNHMRLEGEKLLTCVSISISGYDAWGFFYGNATRCFFEWIFIICKSYVKLLSQLQ